MSRKVLIVGDEHAIASLLRDYLQQGEMDCVCLTVGQEVVEWAREHQPCLVILELMLPRRDGLEICREIRTFSAVPILMLTARIDMIDRIRGLAYGADDYLCKPFAPEEAVARVKAVLSRAQPIAAAAKPVSGLVLDPGRITAVINDQTVMLTIVEFNLLQILMASQGDILSRSQIMDQLYDDQQTVNFRTIDGHIKKLRKKLTDTDPSANFIHSVCGLGYRFDADVVGARC